MIMASGSTHYPAADDSESADTDSDVGTTSPGSLKRRRLITGERSKYSGAFKYKTKFNKEWTKTWPFIAGIPEDPYSARCNVCAKSISVAHQGSADIRSHIQSQSHAKLAKGVATQPRPSFPSMANADKVSCTLRYVLI